MTKKIILSIIIFSCAIIMGKTQTNSFIGSYINTSNTISVQFKSMGAEIHGMLQAGGASFAMRGTIKNNELTGKIYGLNGPVDFTASINANVMTLTSTGYNEIFNKLSNQHLLANVDLTPYMIDFRQYNNNNATNNQSGDFDYSYSQDDRGNATENYQTYPDNNTNNTPPSSPYEAYNDNELKNIISGGQLVFYTRTSYVSDNTASSITYINFCANGNFTINYDGSFSVEGNYGGNAQGASYGQNSGTWQLVSYQGQPAVYMAYNNGDTNINPIDKNRLLQGRWRLGNTQYAFQRNKVNCY